MAFSVFRVGQELRVNQHRTSDKIDPKVTGLPDGWLITWSSDGQDGNASGVYMQKYSLQGVPQFLDRGVAVDRLVNTGSTTGDQIWSTATALAGNAGFVVTWIERNADGSQRQVFQQHYSLDGTAQGAAQQVSGTHDVENVEHLV